MTSTMSAAEFEEQVRRREARLATLEAELEAAGDDERALAGQREAQRRDAVANLDDGSPYRAFRLTYAVFGALIALSFLSTSGFLGEFTRLGDLGDLQPSALEVLYILPSFGPLVVSGMALAVWLEAGFVRGGLIAFGLKLAFLGFYPSYSFGEPFSLYLAFYSASQPAFYFPALIVALEPLAFGAAARRAR